MPKPGAKSAVRLAYEQQRWLRRGRNWRAGLEGRSRGRQRGQALARCRFHRSDGLERRNGQGYFW
jgi:hypothetical protein